MTNNWREDATGDGAGGGLYLGRCQMRRLVAIPTNGRSRDPRMPGDLPQRDRPPATSSSKIAFRIRASVLAAGAASLGVDAEREPLGIAQPPPLGDMMAADAQLV
jgi:hypothetical protein